MPNKQSKPAGHHPDYVNIGLAALAALLVIGILLSFAACVSTVALDIVVPAQASVSGSVRNSGIISRTATGYIVDGNLRARYNELIAIYGRDFLPPLKTDAGIALLVDAKTPAEERWLIDLQHFDDFAKMNLKKHSGIAPVKS